MTTDHVRDARARWQNGVPGAMHAQAYDATTQYQLHWMDAVLSLVDMAMEDEGIAADTRRRVIRAAVYGSPNPADAELRIRKRQAELAKIRERPPHIDEAFLADLRRLEGR